MSEAIAESEAEAPFRLGCALWREGRREEAVAALRRAVALDPRHVGAQCDLGNALVELGRPEEALASCRAALRLRPRAPEQHHNLGNALLAMRRPREAETCFRAACALDPAHAGAHNNLGNALRAQGRHAEAIPCYERALALRPDMHGTLHNIGNALLALQRPEEAEAVFRRVLALRPDFADACNSLGGALTASGRTEEGLHWFRRAVALDPGQVKARFGEALALLRLGRLREGWEAYESRWLDPDFRDNDPDFPEPVWTGDAVEGRTVLLYAEQGLGDAIQFVRYAPLLRRRGARVILAAPAEAAGLFAPLCDVLVRPGEEIPPFDLRCPLLSLPRAFATELDTIPAEMPYLRADPARIAAWEARLGPRTGPRVGLAWSGNPQHAGDALRSIPLARLEGLLLVPGIEFHAVQKELRTQDIPALEAMPALRRHGEALGDLGETAALLSLMDLVISVDTAVAHLAGALARPLWLLLPAVADFRWLEGREDTPWYPTARLFRQPRRNDWDSVLERVVADLNSSQ